MEGIEANFEELYHQNCIEKLEEHFKRWQFCWVISLKIEFSQKIWLY